MPTKTPSRAKSKAAPAREPVHTPRPSKSVVAAASGPAVTEDVATPIIYCTIAAAHRLPAALLLWESLIAAQGAVDFRLLIAENPALVAHLRKQLPAALQVLGPDDVGAAHWLHTAFCCEREQLAAALQPALLGTLVRQGHVVYLAPQSEVLAPLAELTAALQTAEVIGTPSVMPTSADAGDAARGELFRPVNLGLLGIKHSAVAERLLQLWQDLVAEHGAPDDAERQFTGPLWLRAVAATAPQLGVLPAPQYAAPAPLAAAEAGRTAARQGEDRGAAPTAPTPPVWLQYAERAASPQAPIGVAPSQDDAPDSAPPDTLHARYLRKLAASPYRHLGELPYSFGHYLSGAPITRDHRRALGRLSAAGQRLIDNPFAAADRIAQLADPALATLPGTIHPMTASCAHCMELEARLSRLPYSLIGYAGKALDRLGPGARDRMYHALQRVSAYSGRLRDRARQTPKDERADTIP